MKLYFLKQLHWILFFTSTFCLQNRLPNALLIIEIKGSFSNYSFILLQHSVQNLLTYLNHLILANFFKVINLTHTMKRRRPNLIYLNWLLFCFFLATLFDSRQLTKKLSWKSLRFDTLTIKFDQITNLRTV